MRTLQSLLLRFRAAPLLLLLCWAVLNSAYGQTCGLVTNAGFENDLAGWTNAGGTSITSDSHSGSKAAVVTAQGGLNSSGTYAVSAGQQVTFQVWAKTSGSPVWAGVGLDFINSSGTEVGEINLPITTTSYTLQSVTQAAPAGTANVRIWVWKTGSHGSLYVDDFCITVPVNNCGEMNNSSFENGLTGWTNTGSASVTSDTHSGANAAVIGTAEGGLNYGTTIAASGGQSVTFEFWAKASGSPVWAGVGIDYLNSSGTEIDEEVLPVTATSYTKYSVTATAPSGTASINVWSWKTGNAGNLYLDDFCLELDGGGGGGTFDVTIDKSVQHQTMDGFGFFGAMNNWWGSPSTLWSSAWGDQVISDLGITIWRNEYYPPADQYSGQDADWNKQKPVVEGLKAKADQYGVDLKFVFTVWSPPSSMKVKVENNTRLIGTPHPYGTKQGGALDPTKYNQFANWLIDGIELYEDSGIDLYALSPQNEPFFVEPYNSCWYKQEWYPEMLINAIPTVKAAHPNVKIFGSENMLELEALDINWQWFYHKQILDNQSARNNIDILAVHGYSDGVAPTSGSVLAQLWISHKQHFADPMGKRQWMTETSGYEDAWLGSPGAFSLAQDMMSALNFGDITGWIWWQGSENPGSSNIGEYALMNGLVKGKKYYVSKQFYRYIRPGAIRVDATSTNSNVFVSAFHHPDQGTHTIVLINTATSTQNITVGGSGLPSSFTIFRTSATDNCANVGTYSTGSNLSLPPRSVVTLQAGGTPLATSGGSGLMALSQPQLMSTEQTTATRVYPNPMNGDVLTVDLKELRRNGSTQLQLMDANGALLRTYTAQYDTYQIRRQDLPGKGIYILKVISGNEVENVRLVIE